MKQKENYVLGKGKNGGGVSFGDAVFLSRKHEFWDHKQILDEWGTEKINKIFFLLPFNALSLCKALHDRLISEVFN